MSKKIIVNIIASLIIIAFIVGFYFMFKPQNANKPYIVIIKDKEVIEKIDYQALEIEKEFNFNTEKGEVVIKVYQNGAYFESSFCPDKLCIKRGTINTNSLFNISTCIYANISIELRYE